MKFRVTIESDEDGVFVAECPALPGCISQGKTRDEAMANIRDAIQGYVESLKKHGEPIPAPITEAVVEENLVPRGVSQGTLDPLRELFQTCNLARYAPIKSSQELAAIIPKVEAVLRSLQEVKV